MLPRTEITKLLARNLRKTWWAKNISWGFAVLEAVILVLRIAEHSKRVWLAAVLTAWCWYFASWAEESYQELKYEFDVHIYMEDILREQKARGTQA